MRQEFEKIGAVEMLALQPFLVQFCGVNQVDETSMVNLYKLKNREKSDTLS